VPEQAKENSPKIQLSKIADAKAPIMYGIVQPGPAVSEGVAFVQSRDVGGALNLGSLQKTSEKIAAQYRRSKLHAGDILFSLRGNIGESSIVPRELDGANIARGIARIRVGDGFSTEYIRYALQAPEMQRMIARNANGSTFRELSIDELRKLRLPAPPLSEQRKIAAILRTWDEVIEKLEDLRTLKDQRLEALRAFLLFGKLRTDGRRKNWQPRRLAEVTHELTNRNGEKALGRDVVKGVTNTKGIVPMRDRTIADDITRYKRLPSRAFAYNPMRINVGSIAMNDSEEEVLVSPDYVVFACSSDNLDPKYFEHLCKTQWWNHYINSGGSGSVRMRTYYADLAALKLPLPDIEEQRAITGILNAARDDLELTERNIAAVTRQKRGLMQKLLTGEWGVISESCKEAAA
jgi:type I restriction enzyme S subunit